MQLLGITGPVSRPLCAVIATNDRKERSLAGVMALWMVVVQTVKDTQVGCLEKRQG